MTEPKPFLLIVVGAAVVMMIVQVTLKPTSSGTDVSLVINPAGAERLPDRLNLELTPRDRGINDSGGPLTDAALVYSTLPDELTTDGQRASLRFSVASVGTRRVIFPVPYSSALRFNSIQVDGGSTPSCLQSSGAENIRLHYFPCTIDPSGRVRYSGGPWAPESIRLEVPR